MADIGKLSASKISMYKGCGMAYFLNYIEHKKVPRNVRLAFGKSIHHMLDRFYKVNYKSAENFAGFWRYYWAGTVSGEFLIGKEKRELQLKEYKYPGKDESGKRIEKSIFVENHIDLGPEPVGIFFGYMKLGENILKVFYNRHKFQDPPIFREIAFGKKKTEPIEMAGHLITGVFDRIDTKNEKIFITDYKTDKQSPEKDSFILHRSPQFTLYSYAFRQLFHRKENVILYYHLRTKKIFKTYRNEKDYDYLKRLLDEVATGILKNKFTPHYDWHCGFCDFRSACEEYCVDYHGGPRIDLEGKITEAKRFRDWDSEIPDWIESQIDDK